MPNHTNLINWDAAGERLFETGVDRGVLYLYDTTNRKYSPGVAWNGLTGVTESPSGADATDFWADNIKYASLRAAETFGCTIEAYTYPDEFMECDGSKELVANSGVTIGQQARKTFGFCFRTKIGSDVQDPSEENQANPNYKLHLIYGCSAAPSDRGYQTINDSPDAITFSWEVETTPVNVTGFKPTAQLIIDASKISAAKLAVIEAKLYGTAAEGQTPAVEAELPLPDEIAAILNAA